ncbi:hypothetical protein Hsar01_00273 [Haloferula sargassicola]|uniref:Metal-dependent hydrolase n=2 Tax=Haloferula sargassicola TaxID=490096 RepID=A0ABP9UK56_9BACT
MLAGTHALLPVSIALATDCYRLSKGREEAFPAWSLPALGLFGVLPDLCSPHLSLEARHASFSHTLLFLAILVPVVAAAAGFFPKGSRLLVAISLWLASMLHLAADAISGGIPWLHPWSDAVLGDFYIDPVWWIAYDAAFVLGTALLLMSRRRLRAGFFAPAAESGECL